MTRRFPFPPRGVMDEVNMGLKVWRKYVTENDFKSVVARRFCDRWVG